MRDLLEDDNARVRALAEARIGQKSTLLQTRAETLGWMASRGRCRFIFGTRGRHTTPVRGRWLKLAKFQAWSDIRRAIMAPQGYLLAAIDLSQIECRSFITMAGGPQNE